MMAGLLNGLVGVLSVLMFNQGHHPYFVSFYKCLFAVAFLLLLVIVSNRLTYFIAALRNFWGLSLCAFFGFFMLFFFETLGYGRINVASVVFILFATSIVTVFTAGALLAKRALVKVEIICIGLALFGLFLFLSAHGLTVNFGVLFSALAGLGYGLFMVYAPKLKVHAGLEHLTWLMIFASCYLCIPFFYRYGFTPPSLESLPLIMLLALLPTIGGFFCTLKALSYIQSGQVIITEISELLFAAAFAFLLFSQKISITESIGAAFIILAILSAGKIKHRDRPIRH